MSRLCVFSLLVYAIAAASVDAISAASVDGVTVSVKVIVAVSVYIIIVVSVDAVSSTFVHPFLSPVVDISLLLLLLFLPCKVLMELL